MKDNITIRVKGYNWKQFETTWSKNGKMKTVEELLDHLIKILEYKKEQVEFPLKPTPDLPGNNNLAILGARSKQVNTIIQQ